MTEEKVIDKNQVTIERDADISEMIRNAAVLHIPYLEETPKVNSEVAGFIPEKVAREQKVVAFDKDNQKVKVATIDPQNIDALNVLRFISEKAGVEFELYLTTEKIFNDILEQYSGGAERAIEEAMVSLQDGGDEMLFSEGQEVVDKEESVQSAPVTKLLSVIIKHAIEGKASDIHIEPVSKEYRVRFRLDGVLHSSLSIPKEVGRAVVSRIKILSNLKIDEKRKPQDGRFRVVEGKHPVDFRVSTLPVVEGEKVVLRLLDKDDKTIDIEQMGLIGKGGEILLKNIREPYGIILMTGPTGSGKSTTLYACLQILNHEERNIITLEDPVEYSIQGINQSQINPEIGYTFASGLRSILRQDPNVIMVGEIRDGETAELTIHAALTGHLVLSTLHTNSSIGAIPRLVDMGIEPFLLASSMQVVAAQRLVRRICQKCIQKVELPEKVVERLKKEIESIKDEEIKKYGLDLSKECNFFEGKGCEECGGSGYKGRIAIFEALEINKEIRAIISESGGSEIEVQKYAEKQGMITMKQDGILKAFLGHTTLSEVERVTEGSSSVGGEVDDDMG